MKSQLPAFLLLCAVLLLVTGCSSDNVPAVSASPPQDLPDSVMRESVMAFLNDTGAPVSSLYEYSRIDLDNDGRRDAFILFKNPYGYWCGQNGCTMLVMHAEKNRFELVNAIQPVRGPLYVSDSTSHGWKTLVIPITGRWSESKDVAMMYDGTRYPGSPDAMPPYTRLTRAAETRVFY